MITEIHIGLLRFWWQISRQPKCSCCGRRDASCDDYNGLMVCGPCEYGAHEWCGCSCPGCNPGAYSDGRGRIALKHTCKSWR